MSKEKTQKITVITKDYSGMVKRLGWDLTWEIMLETAKRLTGNSGGNTKT